MKKRPHIFLILPVAASLGLILLPFSSLAQSPPASQEDAGAKEEKMQFADTSGTDIELFNQTISNKNKIKSLFFTQAEITDIHLAINTYLKNSGRGGDFTFDEEAFLNRLGRLKGSGNATQSARFYTYPQFFLDSIVYDAPESWIIWLNGVKITQDTPRENSDIQVVAIDKDKVTLEWVPIAMDKVSEVWNQVPNDEIDVDTLRGKVSFTLRPNQTFSSYVMKVLEGRVLPVTVDTTLIKKSPAADTEAMPAPPPALPPAEAEKQPVPQGSGEGLSGLINSYKNMKTGDEK